MDSRNFFSDQCMSKKTQTVAAVLVRNQATKESKIAHFSDQVFAESTVPVIVGSAGCDFLLGEITSQLLHFS